MNERIVTKSAHARESIDLIRHHLPDSFERFVVMANLGSDYLEPAERGRKHGDYHHRGQLGGGRTEIKHPRPLAITLL